MIDKTTNAVDTATHQRMGGEIFNYVWSLLDKTERTESDDEEMAHAAHASRFHWGLAGTAKEWSIGEWQISRVYSVLRRSEPAIHHGRRALQLADENHIGAFFVAYGYEALARAYAVAGDYQSMQKYLDLANRAAGGIPEPENRKMLDDDLASVALMKNLA